MHFRAYIEQSKCVPTASSKGESASDYYVLVGISFSKQKILKACTMETASFCPTYGDMTDASVAVLKGKEYIFSEKEMDLRCAFRLRAPFAGQQRVHAEESMALLSFHLGQSFATRETAEEKVVAPFSSRCACVVLLFYSLEAFYTMPCSLEDAGEKDIFVIVFSWIAERLASHDCQLRIVPIMANCTVRQKVFIEVKYGISLKLRSKEGM